MMNIILCVITLAHNADPGASPLTLGQVPGDERTVSYRVCAAVHSLTSCVLVLHRGPAPVRHFLVRQGVCRESWDRASCRGLGGGQGMLYLVLSRFVLLVARALLALHAMLLESPHLLLCFLCLLSMLP